jgi:hypothetical protein
MARHAYDPREVITGASAAPLRQVAAALVTATLVALLLGSRPLLTWAEELPVGPFGDTALEFAVRWHDAMSTIGLDKPYDATRAAFQAFKSRRL